MGAGAPFGFMLPVEETTPTLEEDACSWPTSGESRLAVRIGFMACFPVADQSPAGD